MQSLEPVEPATPAPDLQARAIGCAVVLAVVLLVPLVLSVLFFLMSVAANNWWAFVEAWKGGY